MTGDGIVQQQVLEGDQAHFSIGKTKKTVKGNKPKTTEELAEQRRQEMFSGNIVEFAKRQREDYSVKLRKVER